LFYVSPGGQLFAAPVVRRATLEIGQPRPLFQIAIPAQFRTGTPFDVSPDGQRFLIAVPEREAYQLTFIQNWAAGLADRN
jgi:hypothetical protein